MSRKGFSLIELSVVILVIAVIIAGITQGIGMKKQSELRAIVKMQEEIQIAMQTFYTTYNRLPGDMDDATTFFTGTNNGNGDGYINFLGNSAGAGFSEAGRVFEHMSKAEIYDGNFVPGTILADSAPVTNMTPGGPRSGWFLVTGFTPAGGYSFVNRNNLGGNSVNVIRYGSNFTDNGLGQTRIGHGLFSVEEVIQMDRKIDDGFPRSGIFTGHNRWNSAPSSASVEECLTFVTGTTHDPNLDRGGAEYNIGADFLCNISFDTPW